MNFDLISIGDITVDDFIRLEDENFKVDGDTLSMPFREKLPLAESTLVYAVGNAPNAAVSAAKLGLKSAHVGGVGDDFHGQETIKAFQAQGVDTQFIEVSKGKRTDYSYVLWVKDDRTILRKHEEFQYSFPAVKTKWVYLSSLKANGEAILNDLTKYLDSNPEVKFALQPGTREINLGVEKMRRLYQRADISFCNVGEAGRILGVETLGIKELLKRFKELGPKVVVITDGPKGAYTYDGEKMLLVTPYPDPKPPVERTGAGDAFSSTTAHALALGESLETALKWGAVNSMSVVQHIGAQTGLLTRAEIEEYIKKSPEGFEIREI